MLRLILSRGGFVAARLWGEHYGEDVQCHRESDVHLNHRDRLAKPRSIQLM